MSEISMQKHILGRKGEDIAVEFLKNKGYELITRNYNVSRWGELDAVMRDGNYLVFVEVRTKSNTFFGTPLETIDAEKRRQIVKMAKYYMTKEKFSEDMFCRFDVVGIVLPPGGEPQIEHYKDAFIAGD